MVRVCGPSPSTSSSPHARRNSPRANRTVLATVCCKPFRAPELRVLETLEKRFRRLDAERDVEEDLAEARVAPAPAELVDDHPYLLIARPVKPDQLGDFA